MNKLNNSTPIQKLNNYLYIKREDLIPISFGGNKARKALYFFEQISKGNYDCVVTYGSASSNHCRVVSNICAGKALPCYIISPYEAEKDSFNRKMMDIFDAKIKVVPVDDVHDTIENLIDELRSEGKNPFFIPGGGHGNLGTQAYVDCYNEIKEFEEKNNIFFDYVFLASGTGTTQAGLICGQYMNNDIRKIVGISIARKKPRGRDVVIQSIKDYLTEIGKEINNETIEELTIFDDRFVGDGYGKDSCEVRNVIKDVLIKYGIPLDSTYTGKAFRGMQEYLTMENIKKKNVLFIHTGGTPLFFDDLKER